VAHLGGHGTLAGRSEGRTHGETDVAGRVIRRGSASRSKVVISTQKRQGKEGGIGKGQRAALSRTGGSLTGKHRRNRGVGTPISSEGEPIIDKRRLTATLREERR